MIIKPNHIYIIASVPRNNAASENIFIKPFILFLLIFQLCAVAGFSRQVNFLFPRALLMQQSLYIKYSLFFSICKVRKNPNPDIGFGGLIFRNTLLYFICLLRIIRLAFFIHGVMRTWKSSEMICDEDCKQGSLQPCLSPCLHFKPLCCGGFFYSLIDTLLQPGA